jgi:cytochrome c oxidase subunit 2
MKGWFPEAASSYAGEIDGLIIFITVVVGIWFILAEGVLIYFALRFRRKEGRKATYLPGRTLRAMAFVLVPCALILGFDLLIDGVAAPVWDRIKQTLPPHDQLVRITGVQWAWRFTLPGPDGELDTADDFEVVNDLHVPVDDVVQFELTSNDVLHSIWIPELRLKQDAVPGRTIRGWFKATKEGKYEVICAEICGFGHTMMKGILTVESPDAYREWLESKTTEAETRKRKEEKEPG